MVELFALFLTCRNIGLILRRKGIHPTRYQMLAVFLWIAFEFVAIQLLSGSGIPLTAGTYVVALAAALASLPVSFHIARSAQPRYRPRSSAIPTDPTSLQQ